MKARLLNAVALAFGIQVCCSASETTFIVNNSPSSGESTILTNSISVNSNEVLEVVSVHKSGAGTPYMRVEKEATGFGLAWETGCRIAGPAVFKLVASPYSPGSDTRGFVTVRIEPESFPPGQTLIVPQGTGAIVHIESSTNLVSWSTEWSQTYTNAPDHRFFRLTAERLN